MPTRSKASKTRRLTVSSKGLIPPKDLSAEDQEHFLLLHDFFVVHCPKAYNDNFIISLDPEVVDFHDVVVIVCNLLGYAFL